MPIGPVPVSRRERKRVPPKERLAHLEELTHWQTLAILTLRDALETVTGKRIGAGVIPTKDELQHTLDVRGMR